MATAHYRSQYSDCPLCACDEFDAGFIDERLKADYWPNGWFDPNFDEMKDELKDRFALSVSEAQIKEHWESHVALRDDEYREWARKKTRNSPGEDPYGMGLVDYE